MGSAQKKRNVALEIIKGIVVALVLTLLSVAILAALIQNESASEKSTDIWISVTAILSVMIGTLLSAVRIGEKNAVICGITALGYGFILLAIGILFFDGNIRGIGGRLLAILVGGAIGCAISMKKSDKRAKRKVRSR